MRNYSKTISPAIVLFTVILLCVGVGFAQVPDFSVATSLPNVRVAQSGKASTIVTTSITTGFANAINLSVSGLPTGATATFSKSSLPRPGLGASSLTISAGGSTPLGGYTVTVTGTSSTTAHQALFTLTVVQGQPRPTGYGWHQLPNTNMTSVCLGNEANGMYSDPTMTTTTTYDFDCYQIIPWSGGVIDDNNQTLVVWGGGHSDYAGNEVSALNLNGTPSWQSITAPTMPVPFVWDGNEWEGLQPYFVRAADGGQYQSGASPSSRHTYNSLQYVPYQNKLYSFGGAVANGGFLSQETWNLDLGSAAWTLVGPPYSITPGYPTTAYDPNTGHIIMHDKSWTLYDYNPATNAWTTLSTAYHVDDGTTAVVDPVNNLFVVVGAYGTPGNTGYPSVPVSESIQVYPLTAPYAMQTWSDPSCDIIYRDGGLAWDSALGLVVGYPGGGNQVYLLNTGPQDVVTAFGTVPSHKCLDVPISTNPSPVLGTDYPQNPEGLTIGANLGIFGRFGYYPSLDTFAMVNDRTKNAWTMQLTGGGSSPNFAMSVAPSLTIAEGGQGTLAVTTTASNGFNNALALSAVGAPAGVTIGFSPANIGAPGSGSSTMTVSVAASAAAGTYPIMVNAMGGGDSHNATVTLTITGSGQPTFALTAAPGALSIRQGSQGNSILTSTISGGFNGAISLSAAGAPSGTTVSFSPQSIPAPGSGNSTINIVVGGSTPVGTYPITVTGIGGGVQQSVTVTLTVTTQLQPSFTVSAAPTSLTIPEGYQGGSTITTTISGGFNAAISLSAAGAPSGATVSFNPQSIAAPGSGSSTMTVAVGASTATGSYPITVTGNGGGVQQTTIVTLTVTSGGGGGGWQQGFDFRNTAGYVSDPAGDNGVLATTAYPTSGNGATYGWVRTALVQGRDRTTQEDPRLAGINFATNGSPATFYVDLPSPGTYNISVALGDAGYEECWSQCQVQFLDGTTVVATITKGQTNQNYFYDPRGNNWAGAVWPTSNLTQQVTLTGTRLTVVVGTSHATGDYTPLAFLGISQNSTSPNYSLTASPASLSVQQGSQGISTISSTIGGGFNAAISLSASGVPAGTTVTFNPQTIGAPGSGNSTMNISVGASTAVGTYPITVTGNGGGLQRTATVTLTVTAQQQPGFGLSAAPAALSVQQGNQGNSTITSTISGGFNGAISLSAAGMPAGTTVSFNPQTIVAPGSGNSSMSITVGASTPAGTYPITVTGNGGGLQQSTTVTLTVTTAQQKNYTLSAAPVSLTIQQGNQGSSTITSTISGGFNGAIALSAAGLPSGAAATFNPLVIPAPGAGNTTMNITVGASTPVGTYPITVTGFGGGIQQTTTVTLTVTSQQQPSFALTAAPASLSVQQGSQGSSTINATISGGFNAAIALSAAGMPAGTTMSFSPQTIPAPGSGNATMNIIVGASTATGTYPITVTGNGGGLQRSTTVTLTVTVQQQPTFSLSAAPTSLSVQQGSQGNSTITTAISGGFNAAISLSAAGMPSGATVIFNPQSIPAPGSGSSTMSITVSASTPTGTYPITVTGNGGGVQQNATVTLTVTASGGGGGWQRGFDFRNTAGYVSDPAGDSPVLSTTAYPTLNNGVTFGWVRTALVQARDRNAHQDPRLAGLNFSTNGTPATFNVDLPAAGTYNVSLAMGDAGYQQCWVQCQIQLLDGSTVLATLTTGSTNLNYFFDAKGNNWSAAAWPSSNLTRQVTLTGTRLTVVVGTNHLTGDYTPIAFLGIAQPSGTPNYVLSAAPAAVTVQQGNQGSSTITSTISGGFNGAISLSAAGMPTGTTVSFSPNPIAAPGSGNSTMTITVGASTPVGTYPITVTGNGGGVQQTATVTLTVTAPQQPNYALSAAPAALTVQQGNQGSSTITSTISGGFNGAITLSAAGMPAGTTVSFAPNPIAAPGSGNSTMTITVGASTAVGTYPITVTGNGGGIQRNATVTLTVTAQQPANFTLSAAPAALSIQQGSQGNSTITATISGNFDAAISVSAAGVPSGATVSFAPNPIPAPGSGNSTMSITVGANTATGSYPITVTGNGGGVQQNTTVTLTVTLAGGGGGANSITVQSTSGATQTNRPITIGRFFADGEIPPGQCAQPQINGSLLSSTQWQCDAKNHWPDGSRSLPSSVSSCRRCPRLLSR